MMILASFVRSLQVCSSRCYLCVCQNPLSVESVNAGIAPIDFFNEFLLGSKMITHIGALFFGALRI